jgi:Flp pilus assembly protein TadG
MSFIGAVFRINDLFSRLRRDERGIAATEFAVIVPLMLLMFFGTVEMSSGVAVDRKVTLIARTLSDLTSQSTTVVDADMTNFFNASGLIMWPYSSTPIQATVTQLYINPTTLKATVQWSKGNAPRTNGSQVVIPSALAVAGTYLIFSEVSYLYVPTIGYVMSKTGVTLRDVNYTRPRQSTCVLYGTASCTTL